mmetsp:Transcript_41412/g.63804  ORF Transcript_41412/g.63804 Transcript_41412/m.63804 type:complete len:214 (+) Transcript_41412:1-642(+)
MSQTASAVYGMAQQVFRKYTSNFHIFGISMGGMIAQTILSEKDTSNVLSVILGCTAPGIQSIPPPLESLIAMTQPDPSWSKEKKARSALEVCYTPSWIQQNELLFDQFVKKSLLGNRPLKSLMAQSQAIGDYYSVEPKRINKPTLIVHGTEDYVLPYENGKIIHRQLLEVPGNTVEFHTMPNIGHIFWNMDMDDTVKTVLAFTEKHEKLQASL